MAFLGQNFDASTVEPSSTLEAVPPGTYEVAIIDSDMKDTKKGDGQYLQLTLEIAKGDYKGRKIFERLNIDNPNEVAKEIAFKTLSAICRAVGVLQVKDSNQLHSRPMFARVDVEKRDGYEPSNVVKKYLSVQEGEADIPFDEPAKGNAPSWARK